MSVRFDTVVLTGATSGIGEATALRLAGMAHTLILLGVEPEQEIMSTIERIRRAGSADIHYIAADFTHLSEVADAARRVRALAPSIDLLINDAGVPGAPERIVTLDGYERTVQVNALAPALFSRLVVPALAEGARIVNVGSSAHRIEHLDFQNIDLEHDYSPIAAYARAKLAMVTWSSLLAEEEAATSTTVVTLCPGLNDTPLSAAMTGGTGGPPSRGAARVLFAASADVPSGSYLENDSVTAPSSEVLDRDNRARLAALFAERLAPFARRSIRTGR